MSRYNVYVSNNINSFIIRLFSFKFDLFTHSDATINNKMNQMLVKANSEA